MSSKRLELTWIGKEQRPRLEPRILLEDPELSYHAAERVTENDIFDNHLIFGDNLLALKALEQKFAGQVKCIYIDPPFNTEATDVLYDDSFEHSIWLTMMRDRWEILYRLLSNDGILFMQLDDEESAYAKVLMDEIFGRRNYVNTVIVTTNKPFGFKGTGDCLFKQANSVLVYAKSKVNLTFNEDALYIKKGYDPQYKWVFKDLTLDESKWEWKLISDVVAELNGFANAREAKRTLSQAGLEAKIAAFALENHERVFRTASVSGGALAKRRSTIELSKKTKNRIVRHPGDDMDYMFIGGERVLKYSDRLRIIDGNLVPAEQITDVWSDIAVEGLSSEGGVDFPRGKKPEALIRRILSLVTRPGDLVLDSFAGSGTTAAVAHKMNRRWVAIELREHCHTHIIPRLKKVIDGTDQSGVSKAQGWKGGGGFRYYKLAPSLLKKDKYGQWVVNESYNAEMLAEAMCKHMSFTYAPSDEIYWMHGRSTESDYIYVTTQTLSHEALARMSEEVGENRTLLICCSAWTGNVGQFKNLTVQKIPNAILNRCEYGHDDYSLKIENLPMRQPEPEPPAPSAKRKIDTQTPDLFAAAEESQP